MYFDSTHRKSRVIGLGATALCLTISAGAAHAISINLTLDGFSVNNGSTSVTASELVEIGNVIDGGTLSFGQTFSVTSDGNSPGVSQSITRQLALSVDGSLSTEMLDQDVSVSFRSIQGDGGGPSGSLTFARDTTFEDPNTFSFTFTGVGVFEVDVGGADQTTSSSTSSNFSDGSGVLPINVSFTAEPEPEPSPVPLPAALPLLIGGLGALGALRSLRRKA